MFVIKKIQDFHFYFFFYVSDEKYHDILSKGKLYIAFQLSYEPVILKDEDICFFITPLKSSYNLNLVHHSSSFLKNICLWYFDVYHKTKKTA